MLAGKKRKSLLLFIWLYFPLPTQSKIGEAFTWYRDHVIMLAVWWRMSEALSLSAITARQLIKMGVRPTNTCSWIKVPGKIWFCLRYLILVFLSCKIAFALRKLCSLLKHV